jgi:hypothetical protein
MLNIKEFQQRNNLHIIDGPREGQVAQALKVTKHHTNDPSSHVHLSSNKLLQENSKNHRNGDSSDHY